MRIWKVSLSLKIFSSSVLWNFPYISLSLSLFNLFQDIFRLLWTRLLLIFLSYICHWYVGRVLSLFINFATLQCLFISYRKFVIEYLGSLCIKSYYLSIQILCFIFLLPLLSWALVLLLKIKFKLRFQVSHWTRVGKVATLFLFLSLMEMLWVFSSSSKMLDIGWLCIVFLMLR